MGLAGETGVKLIQAGPEMKGDIIQLVAGGLQLVLANEFIQIQPGQIPAQDLGQACADQAELIVPGRILHPVDDQVRQYLVKIERVHLGSARRWPVAALPVPIIKEFLMDRVLEIHGLRQLTGWSFLDASAGRRGLRVVT